jgi:hypothetical protein
MSGARRRVVLLGEMGMRAGPTVRLSSRSDPFVISEWVGAPCQSAGARLANLSESALPQGRAH